MEQMTSLLIILGLMTVSEVVAKITRNKVPAALLMTICFLVGFWTVVPADVASTSGVATMFGICSYFFIISMATRIPIREMKRQWKTILISAMGILGICVGTFTLGMPLFGKELVYATAPLWTGGNGAMIVMQQASVELGLPNVLTAAILAAAVQFLIGYPLSGVILRKEARRLHNLYESGNLQEMETLQDGDRFKFKPFLKLYKFSSPTTIMLKLTAIAVLALVIKKATGINQLVVCLILGFIASVSGFLEPDALGKAKADGLCMTFMMAFMFCNLSNTTPEIFFSMLPQVVGLGILSTAGMFLMGFVASKIFKDFSFAMCMGIILNCYYGFPANVMLTDEAIDATTTDETEKRVISSLITPKMLVGGFTSVTFVSVFLATICAKLLVMG